MKKKKTREEQKNELRQVEVEEGGGLGIINHTRLITFTTNYSIHKDIY
jgi:hypothetical protein